jgi:hypothetical protein
MSSAERSHVWTMTSSRRFWQQADSFWEHLFAILQGVLWPAFMVYEGFKALGA